MTTLKEIEAAIERNGVREAPMTADRTARLREALAWEHSHPLKDRPESDFDFEATIRSIRGTAGA